MLLVHFKNPEWRWAYNLHELAWKRLKATNLCQTKFIWYRLMPDGRDWNNKAVAISVDAAAGFDRDSENQNSRGI